MMIQAFKAMFTTIAVITVYAMPGIAAAADRNPPAGNNSIYDQQQINKVYQGENLFSGYAVRKIISTDDDGSVRMTLSIGMVKDVPFNIQFLAPVSPFIKLSGPGNAGFRYSLLGLDSPEKIQSLVNEYHDTNPTIATFAFQLLNQPRKFTMTSALWFEILMEKGAADTEQTKVITLVSQGEKTEDSIRIFKEYPVLFRVPEKAFTLDLFNNPDYQSDESAMNQAVFNNQLAILKGAGIDVIAETNDNKPVLVAFFDPGCQHCQAAKPVLEEIRSTDSCTARIHTIMLDTIPDLARQLSVKTVPTYYYYYKKEGKIHRQLFQGKMDKDEFAALLQAPGKE